MKTVYLNLSVLFLCFSTYGQVDTVIYGLSRSSSPAAVYLAKINPATGVVTNISDSSISTNFVLTSTTIDPIDNIFYFIKDGGNGKFTGVDLTTGDIISNPSITNTSGGTYFDKFLFNCADTTIYGLARNNSPAVVYLAKINPATGVVTNISTSSVSTNINITSSTIDPIHKIFYFIKDGGSGKFTGVDLTTGNVISSPSISNASNGTYFDKFLFNFEDTAIYGLGRNSSPAEIYLAKINPVTGVVTNISTSPVSTNINITSSTIDPINKIFYFMKDGGSGKFTGVDMTTGNVVSSPIISNTYFDGFRRKDVCNLYEPPEVKTIENSDDFSIFPNPATASVTVKFLETGDYSVEVVNSIGRSVYTNHLAQTNEVGIDLSEFPKGLYFIQLKKPDIFYSRKILLTY